MIDHWTAVYLTESVLSDRSPVYGVRVMKAKGDGQLDDGRITKHFDVHFHCESEEWAGKLYDIIGSRVVEIEPLKRRATE